MTIRREDGNGMRHSSSWPDRSRRTVRVRVDPLSRAFTIVPAAVSRSEEEEEKLEIFRKSSGDNTEKIEKKDEESSIREADRKSGARREFQKKTLHSSLRALNRHRLYVETSLSSTISTGRRRGRSNSSIELKIFDVASIHGLNDDGVGSVKKEAKRETTFPRKKRNGFPTGNQQTCRPYDLRKEATLRRHYYPEGGWGYVIVTCSMLVHFLGIGLQFAAPGSWHVTAELKFHHPPLHSAGKLWGCLAASNCSPNSI
ncbi:hypothetical protein KPH14_010893 [Odynerus spinipes]|uniref:Uncharacterized protein n=1 Tax=Odynerus spinipes TaxID=1348599 RepID=A0AAD9RH15_9HYME|nr:hypothetical protein KPH14_010893 [Odynerus spinipes]